MMFRRQPNGDYTTPDKRWLIRKGMRVPQVGHGAMWLIYDNSILVDEVQGLYYAKLAVARRKR